MDVAPGPSLAVPPVLVGGQVRRRPGQGCFPVGAMPAAQHSPTAGAAAAPGVAPSPVLSPAVSWGGSVARPSPTGCWKRLNLFGTSSFSLSLSVSDRRPPQAGPALAQAEQGLGWSFHCPASMWPPLACYMPEAVRL